MSKKMIGMFVGVIIIIIVSLLLFTSPKKPITGTPVLSQGLMTVTLTPLAPTVFLSSIGNTEREITSSTTAMIGSKVNTNDRGRALIEGFSHKMILDYNTELTLRSESSGHTSGRLSFGSVWSSVEKVFEKGEFYDIKTDNAVAAARGTSYGVTFRNGVTTIYVTDGSVLFIPKDPVTDEEDITRAVLVVKGKKAIRSGTSDIILLDIAQSDLVQGWYIFNNKKTESVTPTIPPVIKQIREIPPPPITPSAVIPIIPQKETLLPLTLTPSQVLNPIIQNGRGGVFQPALLRVSPERILVHATEEPITITGTGFNRVKTIFLNSTPILNFTLIEDTQIIFGLPLRFTSGTYDLHVVSDNGERGVLKQALVVYESEPPTY